MTDLARWKLRGPVRTLREEHAEWDASARAWSPPRHAQIVAFLPDGRFSESEFHNPDGSVARKAYLYDRDGRIVETQSWMEGHPKRRHVFFYEAGRQLTEVVEIGPDGTRRVAETVRYDSAGRRTSVRFLEVPQTDVTIAYGIEGSEISYSAPGAVTSTTIYDEADRPTEVGFHDATHARVSRIVLARDREGRVLSEINYFDGGTPRFDFQTGDTVPAEERAKLDQAIASVFERGTFSAVEYAYDQHGRVLQRTDKMGILSEDRTTYRHDDHGNPIEEFTESAHRSANVHDNGAVEIGEDTRDRREVRFEYKYDDRGNWTERVVRIRDGADAGLRPSNVTWRSIAYYDA